jgi:hypothetical protein
LLIHKLLSEDQKSMISNVYKSLEVGKTGNYDLLYFVEDDYIHEKDCLNEMLFTYEKICKFNKG